MTWQVKHHTEIASSQDIYIAHIVPSFVVLYLNVMPVKSKVEISQNFVAFSEYMNFTGREEIMCPRI